MMKVTWLGHSCFLVEDTGGTKVITDPFDVDPKRFADRGLKFAYPPLSGVQADLELISHEHFDHNAQLMSRVEEKETTSVEITPGQVLALVSTVFVFQAPKEVE